MDKSFKIIVCCDEKNGIGKDNNLPWNIKSEMKLFKNKTIGNKKNCVIMGKNTFLSIPEKYRPLKDRDNYVITNDINFKSEKNINIINLENILNIFNKHYDNYWIIGGEMLYNYALTHLNIDEIHITIIKKDYKCNKFFILPKNIYYEIDKTINIEDNYEHLILKKIKHHNTDCL